MSALFVLFIALIVGLFFVGLIFAPAIVLIMMWVEHRRRSRQ